MACNRTSLLLLLLGSVSLLSATHVLAQQMFIYPSKGQSSEQQSRDQYECHSWAVQQTGFDPTVSQAQAPPPSSPAQGGVVRGGARGAAVGAVGGAITGNAGKGAAVGAAAGGLLGGMKQADQNKSQQQAQAQAASQQAATRDAYNRALRACLTGRGYTIQ